MLIKQKYVYHDNCILHSQVGASPDHNPLSKHSLCGNPFNINPELQVYSATSPSMGSSGWLTMPLSGLRRISQLTVWAK